MIRFDERAAAKQIIADAPVLYGKLEAMAGIERKDAELAVGEVVRFLVLVAEAETTLTPSEVVDKAWHEFILCTRVYSDFCMEHFGRYIHHHPGGDPVRNSSQFQQTLDFYRARYGSPSLRFWDSRFQVAPAASGCGACDSN